MREVKRIAFEADAAHNKGQLLPLHLISGVKSCDIYMPSPTTSIEPFVKPLTGFQWSTDRCIDPNSHDLSSAFGTPQKAEHYEVQSSLECGEHSAGGNLPSWSE